MHVTVCAVVFRDGRVLTVFDHYNSLYRPVTGFVEDGEAPSRSALRELKEETGYVGDGARLFGVYQVGKRVRNIVIAYAVNISVPLGQSPAGEEETSWQELAFLIKQERDLGFKKIYSDYAKILSEQKPAQIS